MLDSSCPFDFCLSFRVSELCPEVTSWTDQPFVTNFVMVVHHRDQPFVTNFIMVVHHRESIVNWKKWVAIFKWKPQWWLILSKYDCFCCIIWTTGSSEPFVIKRGMVVHHKCHAKEIRLLSSGSRSLDTYNQSIIVSIIFWAEYCSTKRCWVAHHHKPECHVEKLLCCVQG